MFLLGIMVVILIILDWIFDLMNTSTCTVISCRLSHKWDWPCIAKFNLNPRPLSQPLDNKAVFSE